MTPIIRTTDSENTIGTSFHNQTIFCTINYLKKMLGIAPTEGDGDKVYYEWNLEYVDQDADVVIPFTIYDWKEYRMIRNDAMIYWHIGTKTAEEGVIVQNELVERMTEVFNEF